MGISETDCKETELTEGQRAEVKEIFALLQVVRRILDVLMV